MLYGPIPRRRRYVLTEKGRFWLCALALCALWWVGVVAFVSWLVP